LDFLAWCRARGIIVCPGVPNTAAVSQELDQAYGGFKTGFYVSLASLVEHRLKTASASGQPRMGPADYGMLIFGGNEGTLESPNLFEQHFSVKKLKHFWEKVGAVPLTRNCLLNPQVRHEIVMNEGAIDLTADPEAARLSTILVKNKEACDKLCDLGYKGNLFRVNLKIQEASEQPGRLTTENSIERREALGKARSAGVHFKVTGGDHLTSDDMFIATELLARREEITKLESQKQDALGATRRNELAQGVINRLREEKQVDAIMMDDPSSVTNKDLDILLKWKMDSETTPGAVGKNKGTRVAKWIELRNAAVNDDDEPHPNWTVELEAELQRIKNTELTLKDTALEREKQKGVNDACAMIAAASPTTKHALLARLNGAGALNTEPV
jgi:hypothetical protein